MYKRQVFVDVNEVKLKSFAFTIFVVMVSLPSLVSAQLSGNVSYTGTQSGSIFVEAFRENDPAFLKKSVSMINPGEFDFPDLEEGDYNVVSFIDLDGNGILDGEEPWVAVDSLIEVPPGDSSISLDLDTFQPPTETTSEDDDGGCATVRGHLETQLMLGLFVLGLFFWRRTRPN